MRWDWGMLQLTSWGMNFGSIMRSQGWSGCERCWAWHRDEKRKIATRKIGYLCFGRGLLNEAEIMIAFLEGVLAEALPTQVVVNVHGVGYHVMIPLSSFEKLPPLGGSVKILTHLVVREDAHVLFGFMSAGERDLFRLLLHHVSGIGPKLGLAILSGMSVEMFKAAVVVGDIAAISKISGVGKKTAERVVLELKDKVGVAAEWGSREREERNRSRRDA